MLTIGAIIGYFSYDGITVCLQVLSFALGILGVGICTNELLFLLRLRCLTSPFLTFTHIKFRFLEIISLIVGILVTLGWWFSEQNMIVNDIVCLCMVVGFIKILKFTSLKNACIGFVGIILV